MMQDQIFAAARYKLKQGRNKTTRKPDNLPPSNVVDGLSRYLQGIISKEQLNSFQYPCPPYLPVRDATCCRLTIYNWRRGGEPYRQFLYP